MDSGAVIKNIKAKVENSQVRILVVRTFPHLRFKTCHHDAPIKLGKLKPGCYKVVYDSQREEYPLLGSINVPPYVE